MSDENFLFDKPVGMLHGPRSYSCPVEIIIKIVQNGFEICYDDKHYVAKTPEEAKKIASEKIDQAIKEIKKKDK